MNVMLYKEGRGTQVWGRQYKTVIVDDSDVDSFIADGWFKHPSDVEADKEKSAAAQAQKKKTGNDKKPEKPQDEVIDEYNDEG